MALRGEERKNKMNETRLRKEKGKKEKQQRVMKENRGSVWTAGQRGRDESSCYTLFTLH